MMNGDRLPTLEGERVVLRWLTDADAPALHTIFSHPEVCRYWSSPPQKDVAESSRMIRDIEKLFRSHSLYEWGVARRGSDKIVGTATLAEIDRSNRRCEIGFSIAHASWGQGLGGDTIATLLQFAFETLDMHRVEADVDPRNEASLHLLEKLGFQREGLLRERWIVDGQIGDSVMLGLLAREWKNQPARTSVAAIRWKVMRQDDHGNVFEIQRDLSREDAERLAQEFESRGHRQMYWTSPQ